MSISLASLRAFVPSLCSPHWRHVAHTHLSCHHYYTMDASTAHAVDVLTAPAGYCVHPVCGIAGTALQPTTSGGSFGSFASAAESFMPIHTQEAQVALPTDTAKTQGLHPPQRSSGHAWPSSPQWQSPQGSVAQPWPSSPHWQAAQGSTAQPWPTSPQWVQDPAQAPLSAVTSWTHAANGLSRPQLPSNGPVGVSSTSVLMQSSPSDFHMHSNGSQQAMPELRMNHDAAHGGSSDDDGFGDFAAVDNASHGGADVPPAPALQPADR